MNTAASALPAVTRSLLYRMVRISWGGGRRGGRGSGAAGDRVRCW
jgi:hypothetical protein